MVRIFRWVGEIESKRRRRKNGIPENTPNGEDHAEQASVGNSAPGNDPSQRDNQAGLDVSDHGGAHRTGSDDDEELGQVDQGRQHSAL